jgi:hypothetical protein
MNTLLEFVQQKNNQIYELKDKEIENIQSYIFFDEADQTYPLARNILMNNMYDTYVYTFV